MKMYQSLAASAAIVVCMGFAGGLPAFAAPVDEAQCNDAKGTGDAVTIKQFCPEADWITTMSTGEIAPAGDTVMTAQCNDALGSSDQNAIRQYCPEAAWPATMTTGPVTPAGNTVVVAQCNDAKGSGDLNAIKQFCDESEWPADTVN
jgi:hypothetical protein